MSETRPLLSRCQVRLALLWLVGALVLFVLLLGQKDRYGAEWQRAWDWLLPTVLPTLMLIVGVVAGSAQAREEGTVVNPFAFQVAFALSSVYLATLLWIELRTITSVQSALSYMAGSRAWLGGFQGLVSLALGAFFASRKAGESPAGGAKPAVAAAGG